KSLAKIFLGLLKRRVWSMSNFKGITNISHCIRKHIILSIFLIGENKMIDIIICSTCQNKMGEKSFLLMVSLKNITFSIDKFGLQNYFYRFERVKDIFVNSCKCLMIFIS